jgi:hypothetical protein
MCRTQADIPAVLALRDSLRELIGSMEVALPEEVTTRTRIKR